MKSTAEMAVTFASAHSCWLRRRSSWPSTSRSRSIPPGLPRRETGRPSTKPSVPRRCRDAALRSGQQRPQRADGCRKISLPTTPSRLPPTRAKQVNTLSVELAKKAQRFDGLKLPPEHGAQDDAAEAGHLDFPRPNDPATKRAGADLGLRSMETTEKESGARTEPNGKCLDVTAIEQADGDQPRSGRAEARLDWMARCWRADAAALRAAWWSSATKARRSSAIRDAGALWRSNYDMPPDAVGQGSGPAMGATAAAVSFAARVRARATRQEIWQRSWCRRTGPIPAHLLGNIWARNGTTFTLDGFAEAGAELRPDERSCKSARPMPRAW